MTTSIRHEREQPPVRSMPAPPETGSGNPGPSDRSVLRLGAAAAILGLVLRS